MSDPWDDLAGRIDAPEGVSVYPAMAEQIVAPALVIVPDDPWIQSSGYGWDTERYLVIALVSASAPSDGGLALLHRMVHAVREAGGDGWEILDVSGVRSTTIPDDGTRYLGSWVRVSFRDCEHEVSEGS